MKFPDWLKVYGDKSYRGDCPIEDIEQINFVSWLQFNHPNLFMLMIHPKMEGRRTPQQAAKEKKIGGLKKGPSDIIIPGNPSFVCELKRLDHTKSKWQDGQKEYLETAQNNGCFACIALGADGAKEAVNRWIDYKNERGYS